MPRIVTIAGMEDGARIDTAKLKRAILERTGDGKEFTRRGLSMLASDNKNPDVVRDIMRVGNRVPLFDTVAGLARAMGMDVSEFLVGPVGQAGTTKERVQIRAAVEAGCWRDHDEWSPDEWYWREFDLDETTGERNGFRVKGRSMDLRFPEGTDLNCVILIGSDAAVEDGDYVVVERSRDGLREKTVKRLHIRDDGAFELHAESTLPEFAEPMFIGKPDDEYNFDNETRMVAKVLEAKQKFSGRGRRVTVKNA